MRKRLAQRATALAKSGADVAVVAVVLGLMALLIAGEQTIEPDPSAPESVRTFAAAPDAAGTTALPPESRSSAALPPAHGADEIEVCGGGWVKVPDAQGATPERMELERAQFDLATQLTRRRAEFLKGLRASPDELAVAAAHLAESTTAHDAGDEAGAATSREALLRIAFSTRNPQVYALAFKVCGGGARQEGGCRMISARQWARLEPGNAAPWLFMLDDGKGADRAALEDALHRMATATRSDLHPQAAAGALIDAAPPGEQPLLPVYEIVSRMMAVEAAVAVPAYQSVMAACQGEALTDANRAQACEGVATLWSERSTSLSERVLGVAMGRRLGWSSDRTDRLRGEYEAYVASLAGHSQAEVTASCLGLRRELDNVRQQARIGESGVLRAWVTASAKTPDDFIREQRGREHSRQAAAEAFKQADAASAAIAGAVAASAATADR